jgi:hypothetical protein
VPELRSYLPVFPLKLPSAQLGEFDAQGTELWNLSTRLLRDNGDSNQEIPYLLRVLASYMLDAANRGSTSTWANHIRVAKVVLRAAKTCVLQSEHDLGVKMLERAERYLDRTASGEETTPEDMALHGRLKNQYSLLRILLVG